MLKNIFNRILLKIAYVIPGGGSLRPLIHRLRGVKMGKNAWIGQFVYIDELHPDALTVGDNCTIGLRTAIFTHFYWGGRRSREHAGTVTIGKDVFIGPYCVILPNVTIGQGAVIKAGTVVTKNVAPNTFVGLPPAQALAHVTVPLTSVTSYREFLSGLKPIRVRNQRPSLAHPGGEPEKPAKQEPEHRS